MPKPFLYKNSSENIWSINGGIRGSCLYQEYNTKRDWLEFEFAKYDAIVQHISHYIMHPPIIV